MNTSKFLTPASSNLFISLASSICACLLLAVFTPLSASAEIKPDDAALNLQTLEDFHSAAQAMARMPIIAADDSYRARLEKHQKTAQAAGNLKSILAAKQALGELDAGCLASLSDDSDVAAIQKAYIAQREKANAECEKEFAKIDQNHLASLKKSSSISRKRVTLIRRRKSRPRLRNSPPCSIPRQQLRPSQLAIRRRRTSGK